jgi:hypothetical protein
MPVKLSLILTFRSDRSLLSHFATRSPPGAPIGWDGSFWDGRLAWLKSSEGRPEYSQGIGRLDEPFVPIVCLSCDHICCAETRAKSVHCGRTSAPSLPCN